MYQDDKQAPCLENRKMKKYYFFDDFNPYFPLRFLKES